MFNLPDGVVAGDGKVDEVAVPTQLYITGPTMPWGRYFNPKQKV